MAKSTRKTFCLPIFRNQYQTKQAILPIYLLPILFGTNFEQQINRKSDNVSAWIRSTSLILLNRNFLFMTVLIKYFFTLLQKNVMLSLQFKDFILLYSTKPLHNLLSVRNVPFTPHHTPLNNS